MGILDFLFKKIQTKPASKKIIVKDGVEYCYTKYKKSKSVKITIKDRYHVKVSLPNNCKYKIAQNVVRDKKDWIKEHLEALDSNKIKENFKTKTDNFIVRRDEIKKAIIQKRGDKIILTCPINSDFYSPEMQKLAKTAIKRALYIEAKDYLPKRIDELAQKFGFEYNKLALKTHKTRWGSCSFNNNINLNINLMNLEQKYIDYVLVHELCHTVEKNHKEEFWTLVYKCMPDAKNIRKELKKIKSIV